MKGVSKKLNKAAELTGVSAHEFLIASSSAGKALSEVLTSVGLPSEVVMVGETHSQKNKMEKSGGILVALEDEEAREYQEELIAGAKKTSVWEKAMEERRKVGPMKMAPMKRPEVANLPKSAVAAATSLVEEWQLHGQLGTGAGGGNENRCVLVTADDSEDGRTLPLLFASHVGVVCGNTHLTKSKKKGNSNPTNTTTSSGDSTTDAKKKSSSSSSDYLFGDAGDVAMMSGMPLGLSPIADMFTVCISTSRLEHVVMICRSACMIAAATFLFAQVVITLPTPYDQANTHLRVIICNTPHPHFFFYFFCCLSSLFFILQTHS
jgi:hypothetical protein